MSNQNEAEPFGFMATQWSLVRRAGQASEETQRASLDTLLQRYLPALRAHLRIQKRIPAEHVEDLLQGFVAEKVLEQRLIAAADQERGRFRSFLLVALNRYVIDQVRRESAGKRSGGVADACVDEQSNLVSKEAEPARQFNIAWARELIKETLRRMQLECEESGQQDVWAIFQCRIVGPAFDDAKPISYELLVERLGLQAPIQAANLLTTAKRKFARILRSVAGEYAGDDKQIDQEIVDLKSIISGVGA